MNDSEKLDHLAGQVDAMFVAVSALFKTHPNLRELQARVSESTELQTTASLPQTVSESFLQGQELGHSRIQTLVLAALQRRGLA